MTEQTLPQLQQWMKTVITERGSLTDKLESATQEHGLRIEDVVDEKRGLSARQRLSIYTGGYVARLLECMRADFPVLRRFVGDTVFDAFASAYIVTEPPHSPSLFDLGAGFAEFLERTKPSHDRAGQLSAMLDVPAELARLERARTEIMRARGTENDPRVTTSVSPFDILGQDLKVQATPCLRLLELKFSLVDLFDETVSAEPERRPAFVAIARADYRVNVKEVERWQFAFLTACESPASVHNAARQAAGHSGNDAPFVLAQLVLWLPLAIQLGFLREVNCPRV